MNKSLFSQLKVLCISLFLTPTIAANGYFFAIPRQSPSQKGDVTSDFPFAPTKPVHCESFATLLDHAVIESRELKGSYLIVIVRVGLEETAPNLGRLRAARIRSYFEQKYTNNSNHLVAEGSRGKGFGRVEIYVGGKLTTIIPILKNSKTVCSGQVNPFL